jgi:hypothetical protein
VGGAEGSGSEEAVGIAAAGTGGAEVVIGGGPEAAGTTGAGGLDGTTNGVLGGFGVTSGRLSAGGGAGDDE